MTGFEGERLQQQFVEGVVCLWPEAGHEAATAREWAGQYGVEKGIGAAEICEREDPAYTVLHQAANFTAKRKDIRWKTGQSFAMDFRASNWGGMG